MFILIPKFAADGFYFDDDKIDIIEKLIGFADRIDEGSASNVIVQAVQIVDEMINMSDKRKEIIMSMTGKTYWNMLGSTKYPDLYKVAKPVMEMVCSSATAERVWSLYRCIHSRLRNRLTNDCVNKLAFLYTKSVLLDNIDMNDYVADEGAILRENDLEDEDLLNVFNT